ncbi:MAG: hypothetical protein V4651_04655 [Bacteroidota bacterium]
MGIKTGLFENGKMEDLWLHSGSFFLLLGTLPFIIQSMLFMTGIPVSGWLFPIVFIGLSIYCGWVFIRKNVPVSVVVLWYLLMAGMIITTGLVCIRIYDFSYDGVWYHQDAVRLMEQGWNPYHHFLSPEETGRSELCVNHYPKAVWTAGAVVYAFTNKLESAKIINWIFLFASFCLTIFTLRKVFSTNWFWTVLVGLMISFNPVVIYQLFSFYIDGVIANLILCLVLLVLLYKNGTLSGSLFLLLISLTTIFLINTKFTSLVYVCVLSAVYLVYEVILIKRKAIRSALIAGSILALGVLLFGYPTYVNNTLTKGHPFYPIMGEGNMGEDIMSVPFPEDFKGKNRFKQFNLATFAKPVWSRAPESSKPKALFTIEGITYYDEYRRADPEMGGFGPLFAEVVCLLLGGILLLLVWNRKIFTVPVIIGLTGLILSIICIPAFWYARYAPQIWMFVCLMILLLLRAKYTAWLGYTLILMQLMNCYMIAQQNWDTQATRTRELNAFFVQLKAKKNIPVVYAGWTGPFKIKLEENKVQYVAVQRTYPEDSIVYFPHSWMCGAFVVKQP